MNNNSYIPYPEGEPRPERLYGVQAILEQALKQRQGKAISLAAIIEQIKSTPDGAEAYVNAREWAKTITPSDINVEELGTVSFDEMTPASHDTRNFGMENEALDRISCLLHHMAILYDDNQEGKKRFHAGVVGKETRKLIRKAFCNLAEAYQKQGECSD